MTAPFLYHGQDHHWVTVTNDEMILTLACDPGFQPTEMIVRCEPDNEEKRINMHRAGERGRLTLWQGTIPLSLDKDTTLYCFKAVTNDGQWWLDAVGISRRMPGAERHFRYNRVDQPPAWVPHQVFYQIFPDRFCNGDPSISVTDNEYFLYGDRKPTVTKAWGEPVAEHGSTGASEFYGGDLQGIQNQLDHLQTIGVSALYLNPIFRAPSNHKYDTQDYLNIDPHLGSNESFANLCDDLHERGMKIMLDAVFNHTSLRHPWFDIAGEDEQHRGAFNNPASPYRDFYHFDGDSNDYVGWNGVASLPKLNFENPGVQAYFYDSDDCVIQHWLKPPYNIDGWRFDVIHMLGEGIGAKNNAHYVKAFRAAAKAANPDSYVIGEHFYEASKWLQGDQEDGAMNYYGFAHPVRAFFAKQDIAYAPCTISAKEFADWLMEAAAKIPWQNQLSQLNQLDSHDTQRFLHMVKEDRTRFKQALLFLFTWVGAPCIYYGTEVALSGGMDPDNRRCFPWDTIESEQAMMQFVSTLAHHRRGSNALCKGSVQWLHCDDGVIAFARHFDDEVEVCAVNLNDHTADIVLPLWQLGLESANLRNVLTENVCTTEDGQWALSLGPNDLQLWSRC